VNTPDGYESQDGGAKSGSVSNCCCGPRSGADTDRARSNAFSSKCSALRPLIAAHLTEEHSFLFAEPVTDPDTGEVHWYSPVEARPFPTSS
jgi:hypothetical protein